MNKKFMIAATIVLATGSVQAAEVSGTVSFTNDYRVNGISQTSGDAAVQGSLDVAFDNGIYAGIWGSNVDWADDAHLEVDYYIGHSGNITKDLSYSAHLMYVTYPGYESYDIDYLELDTALYFNNFSLIYKFSNDYVNSSESHHYMAAEYSYSLQDNLSLDLHAGHTFGDYWGKNDINDYSDYSVGLSGSVAGLDLSAGYLITQVDSEDQKDNGALRNDNSLIFSVGKTF